MTAIPKVKTILNARVLQKYRNRRIGWYNPIKGHTGVDLAFNYEPLPSPVSGKILQVTQQQEMGTCIYLEDKERKIIHVFAHMSKVDIKKGQKVERGDILGTTGNTGSVTSGAHLHYEVISRDIKDKSIMSRTLGGYSGWNISPLDYIRELYSKYNLDVYGEENKVSNK